MLLPLLVAATPTSDAIVRVGDVELGAAELQARLSALSQARRSALPAGAAGTRAFVDQVLVPELLLERHARTVSLAPAQRDRALAFALDRKTAERVSVDAAEVAAFYAQHRAEFHTEAAIGLWRIVTASEAEAREILTAVRGKANGAELWSALARERSLDAATKMRRGDLGFVRENGHTDVPQVRVNPELHRAAALLSDGELMAEPLRDGEHYSVLWRRGSRPARDVPLEQAAGEIRRVLLHQKGQEALSALVARLRSEQLTAFAPDALESVDYGTPESTRSRRPLVARPAAGPPAPTRTPTGER